MTGRVLVYTRENPDSGLQELVISGGGHDVVTPIDPAVAVRMVAELGDYLRRVMQRASYTFPPPPA